MSEDQKSQRRYRRLGLSLPATIRRIDENGTNPAAHPAKLENLGPDGCFLCTPLPFKAGDRLQVEFYLENFLVPVQAETEVRWVRSGGESAGVGVQFRSMSAFEKSAIGDFIFRKIISSRP